jgi:hypothetical protein
VTDTGSKKVKHTKKISSEKVGGKKVSSRKPSSKKGTSKKLGSKKVELWGGIIEYDEPTPSARTERIQAAIDAGLGRFEQHKTTLITILRNAHHGRLTFDEPKSWSCLISLAHSFFWQARLKPEMMPATSRKSRLDELARALKRSRTLVDAAMQDDVGDDLLSSWCEGTNEPLLSLVRNDDGSFTAVRGPEEMFKKAVVGLAALETAALHAANQVKPPGRGRPPGARVLPVGYIEALAVQYLNSTGSRPDPSRGPFFNFVYAFLAALGRANISEDYVVELIRDAASWATAHPSEWAPSPFSE